MNVITNNKWIGQRTIRPTVPTRSPDARPLPPTPPCPA